jgi:hypothetical protein
MAVPHIEHPIPAINVSVCTQLMLLDAAVFKMLCVRVLRDPDYVTRLMSAQYASFMCVCVCVSVDHLSAQLWAAGN